MTSGYHPHDPVEDDLNRCCCVVSSFQAISVDRSGSRPRPCASLCAAGVCGVCCCCAPSLFLQCNVDGAGFKPRRQFDRPCEPLCTIFSHLCLARLFCVSQAGINTVMIDQTPSGQETDGWRQKNRALPPRFCRVATHTHDVQGSPSRFFRPTQAPYSACM